MSMKGLEKITDKIIAEATAEADRILAEAKAEADAIRADYAARAEEIRTRLADEAARERAEMLNRTQTVTANRKRDAMLAAESAVVDEVFVSAKSMILQYDDEKYTELMAGLLAAALLEQMAAEESCAGFDSDEEICLPERYEVLMNKRDRERVGKVLLPLVGKKLKGKVAPEKIAMLVISNQNVAIEGGLILRCGDIEINCSLSLIFAQLREELEGEVSHALFNPPKRA